MPDSFFASPYPPQADVNKARDAIEAIGEDAIIEALRREGYVVLSGEEWLELKDKETS